MLKHKQADDEGSSHPSLGRRMASKVISLISKFESMSSSQTEEETEKEPPPPVRSIESLVTPTGSISKRALRLRNSLRRKASRLFEKLERDQEENNSPPKRPSPRKKTSAVPRSTNSKQILRPYLEGHKDSHSRHRRAHLSTFRYSKRLGVETEDDVSSLSFDGQVPGNKPSSVLSTSEVSSSQTLSTITPPVAKIFSSSLFTQLVPPEPIKPVKIFPPLKVLQESSHQEIISGEILDPKLFRIGPEKQRSVWKRKITPPKISVKELVSKFRFEAQEESENGSDEEQLAMLTIDSNTKNHLTTGLRKNIPKTTGNASKKPETIILTNDKTFGKPPGLMKNYTNSNEKESVTSCLDSGISKVGASLVSSLAPSGSNCCVRMTGETRRAKRGALGIINQNISQTTKIYNDLEVSYTALARLDTPPSTKKYRKTPPPKGFFRRFGRPKYTVSILSRLKTVTAETEDDFSELSGSTTEPIYSMAATETRTDSKLKFFIKPNKLTVVKNGNPRNHRLAIRTDIPTMPVLTPIPVSAMQNLAIDRFVRRYAYC